MDEKYDVIIFFGPPFAGKSSYFKHILHSTHQRVSATELFTKSPEIGLRQVILKIAALIREGKKVVIDDENWTKTTRISYIKSLSAKFPSCKFLCIKFDPEELVSYWSMEWTLAEKVLQCDLSNLSFDPIKAEAKLNYWYGNHSDDTCGFKLEEPGSEAGLDLKIVKTKLMAEVEYKFEVPALFLQWQAITRTSSDALQFVPGTADLINCWVDSNPWGRVIIVMDGLANKIDSSSSESSQDPVSNMHMPPLCRLCKVISIPIYIFQLQTASPARNFNHPPQPGILAFLQRLHHLHLFHRHTLYLHCTQDHSKMAEEAGVRHTVAQNVLHNPQMVVRPRCATKGLVKSELKDIEFKQRISSQKSVTKLPLYEEAKECNVENDCRYFEQMLPWQYLHGVYFKDKDTIDRYQQLYAETASHISEPGTKMVSQHMDKPSDPTPQSSVQSSTTSTGKTESHTASQANRALPSWLLPKSQRHKKGINEAFFAAPSLGSSLEEEEVPTRGKKSKPQPSTVYCMNVLELLETAQLVLQENGKSASMITDLMNTSPESKAKKSNILHSMNAKNGVLEKEDPKEHPCSSTTSKAENISKEMNTSDLDDVFLTDERTSGRPPPKKKRPPHSTNLQEPDNHCDERHPPIISKSEERQKNVQIPETITTIPETEGFESSSVTKDFLKMSSLPQGAGERSKGPSNERKRTQTSVPGPDLSFLDDIF